MKRIVITLLTIMLITGCASIPKVKYSQLNITNETQLGDYGNDGNEYLSTLIKTMEGAQFGNHLFNKSTTIIWLIPKIHRIDLDLIAREEKFSPEEYKRRLKKLEEFHRKYLVFSLDLRMPLNPKWTKDELIEFLKENLVVTLENGTKQTYLPEIKTFRAIERFQDEAIKNFLMGYKRNLEVSITVRLLFNKGSGSDQIITSSTKKIVVKLRLKNPPPYNIGYFDERLFQGYMWNIDQDG